ncbi:Calcium-dependent protein kinase 4 [Entomortierella beljakovae]|nr:Calcium-dependent protein kinase 4 [Entomortierella beljakovae]
MAAMSISTTSALYNPDASVKYDLISSSSLYFPSKPIVSSNSSNSLLHKSIHTQRFHMGTHHAAPLPFSRLHNTILHHIQNPHKKTQSTQLAGKLEDIMSSPLLIAPLKTSETSASCQSYVYTAPCEHHPSKGQTDYLVNDMFPKLKHDLSTIEFGIRIADFMPLAFKTVPVAGLVERELQLLNDLKGLPNVIQLQDSFVNDNGDTVLVLPMLKKFDCDSVNKTLCSVRKTARQILTGLSAIHAKDIVHLDINPSNLMVTHDKKDVTIIDLGLSAKVDRINRGSNSQIPACGTIGYIAPEVLRPQDYENYDPTLADIYSLGIVLGQMLEQYIPDCDLHYFGSKYLTLENTKQSVTYLKEFVAQGALYPRALVQAADLLRCMLEENPNNRKSAQDLIDTHPFLAMCSESGTATLKLCDWLYRVQEIKYQKYLLNEQKGFEIYRYR